MYSTAPISALPKRTLPSFGSEVSGAPVLMAMLENNGAAVGMLLNDSGPAAPKSEVGFHFDSQPLPQSKVK